DRKTGAAGTAVAKDAAAAAVERVVAAERAGNDRKGRAAGAGVVVDGAPGPVAAGVEDDGTVAQRQRRMVVPDGAAASILIGRVRDDEGRQLRRRIGAIQNDVVAVAAGVTDPKTRSIVSEEGSFGQPAERAADGAGASIADNNKAVAQGGRVTERHGERGVVESDGALHGELAIARAGVRPVQRDHQSGPGDQRQIVV